MAVGDRDETALAGGLAMKDFRFVALRDQKQRALGAGGNPGEQLAGGQAIQFEQRLGLALHRLHLQETLDPALRQLDLALDRLAPLRLKLDRLLAHLEMGRLAGPQLRQVIEKGAVEIDVGGAVAVEGAVREGVFSQIGAGVDAGATGKTFQPQQLMARSDDRVQQAPQVGPVGKRDSTVVPQTQHSKLRKISGWAIWPEKMAGTAAAGCVSINSVDAMKTNTGAGLSVDEAGLAVAGSTNSMEITGCLGFC
ncbi:MAG: hypothetical protein MZU95_05535 [Desulfomicrobium escambiense]|nr:hypothetical protein [Desulfomicrobium escambiense]